MTENKIAIFASGNGSNAEKFFDYFRNHSSIEITCLLSNNIDAYALTRAQNNEVQSRVFSRKLFYDSEEVLEFLKQLSITHIVLAGFMWLVPKYLINAFPNRMFNIHPALLPKYGGKGMYGHHVHEAVIANSENESGISIHFVNEVYDDGEVIFQARCPVKEEDDPDTLAQRIHKLEYKYYPEVVEAVILDREVPVQ